MGTQAWNYPLLMMMISLKMMLLRTHETSHSPDTSDFAPHTIKLEPDIPEASDLLKAQLMECQSLNSPG